MNVVEKYWNMTNILNHLGFVFFSSKVVFIDAFDNSRATTVNWMNSSLKLFTPISFSWPNQIRKYFQSAIHSTLSILPTCPRATHFNKSLFPSCFLRHSKAWLWSERSWKAHWRKKHKKGKWKTIFYWILFLCSLRVGAFFFSILGIRKRFLEVSSCRW